MAIITVKHIYTITTTNSSVKCNATISFLSIIGSYQNFNLLDKLLNYIVIQNFVSYLLYKTEKLSVCPSIHLHFWHTDNSTVSASTKTALALK